MKFIFLLHSCIISIFVLMGCQHSSVEPKTIVEPESTSAPISIHLSIAYQSVDLVYNKIYKSKSTNDIWFTRNMFYLSNIRAIRADGEEEIIRDIVLIDGSLAPLSSVIEGSIPMGEYTGIEFDLGVKENLNMSDPSIYPQESPLSIVRNMYWGWATQYVFSKLEGFEVIEMDTTSFVIHTGTNDLYRPNVIVPVSFSITMSNNDIPIVFDLYTLLNQPIYTFNLVTDGNSHTSDNLRLATHYMDNFTHAFTSK